MSSKWCERCDIIARWVIPDIVSASLGQHELRLISELGSLDEVCINSSCTFCIMLLKMAERNEQTFEESRQTYPKFASQYALYACRSQDTFLSSFGRVMSTNVFLVLNHATFRYYISQRILSDALNEIGIIHVATHVDRYESQQLQVRRVDSMKINLEVIKTWIKECQTKHIFNCPVMKTAEWCPGCPSRLISCSDRRIVQAKGDEIYAALSYVWGPPTKSEPNYSIGSALKDVPRTISDSINLAVSLGFDYIWIDRYCIDRDQADEVHSQISNMHGIYRCAHLTIIAAAGFDLNHGLPGINCQRSRQTFISNDDYTFCLTSPHPKTSIRRSNWANRGWTYQEGVCSARRLVFTEDQVYFECRTMRCCESLESGTISTQQSNKTGFRYIAEDSQNACFPRNVVGDHGFIDMMERIAEYTSRHLTYQDDIINALLGVFGEFERLENPIYHFWGIPIAPFKSMKIENDVYRTLPIAWEEGFLRGLCWQLSTTSTRRPGFPSWSWTGWIGKISPYNDLYNYTGSFENVKVWLELETGTLVRFPEPHVAKASFQEVLQRSTPRLYLEGKVIKTPLRKEAGWPSDKLKFRAVLGRLKDGAEVYAPVSLCGDPLSLDHESVEGLLVGSETLFTKNNGKTDGFPVILFRRLGGHAERIGSFVYRPTTMDWRTWGIREGEAWECLKLKYQASRTERILFR